MTPKDLVARLRRIRIGQMAQAAAQVTAGLEQDAVVVVHPGDKPRDGARVRPSSRTAGGG